MNLHFGVNTGMPVNPLQINADIKESELNDAKLKFEESEHIYDDPNHLMIVNGLGKLPPIPAPPDYDDLEKVAMKPSANNSVRQHPATAEPEKSDTKADQDSPPSRYTAVPYQIPNPSPSTAYSNMPSLKSDQSHAPPPGYATPRSQSYATPRTPSVTEKKMGYFPLLVSSTEKEKEENPSSGDYQELLSVQTETVYSSADHETSNGNAISAESHTHKVNLMAAGENEDDQYVVMNTPKD